MSGVRSQRSIASLLMVQRLVETTGSPLKAKEYWQLLERVPQLESLLGLTATDMADHFDVELTQAEQMAALFDAGTALAFELEELEQSGLRAVTSVDEQYPHVLIERLGHAAPPVLYAAGDLRLLAAPLLGVVGSRSVDEAGAEVTAAAARAAVRHGHGVASGGAKGVDQLSMRAALEAEGTVVGVLAESLLRTLRDADTRRAVLTGNVCLCTPFKPSAGFSVASAMGRNKVIYALSKATLVVASDEGSGGTWSGATEALKRGIAPVITWVGEGAGPGNEPLQRLGAVPCSDIDALFPLPERQEPSPPAEAKRQLSLGL